MNFAQKLFPSWALNREVSRMNLQRLLEHDKTNKRHPRRNMGNHSGDGVMQHARHKTRESARYLEENNAIATTIMETLINSIVGKGTMIEPMVANKKGELATETNTALKRAWNDWLQYPEVTGELKGCKFEEMIVRSWLRDGDVFGQHVDHSTAYPWQNDLHYRVELLEADMVPFENYQGDERYVHGIRKDAWGRPTSALIYLEHPGNNFGLLKNQSLAVKEVNFERLFHLKWTKRIRQTRGMSILHAVIDTLLDLDDYEDSERVAARINATQTIAITKTHGSPGGVDSTGDSNYKIGKYNVWQMQPGEGVQAIKADRPNPNLDPFVQSQQKRAAGATLTKYSTVAKSFSTSYSAQRQEVVEQFVSDQRLRKIYYNQVLTDIYRNVVMEAMRVRDIPVLGIDQETIFDVDFRGPAMPWIDPQKEAKAAETDIAIGIRSRQQVIRDRGDDPEKVTKELNEDEFKPAAQVAQEQAAKSNESESDPNDNEEDEADDQEQAA